MVGRLYHLPRGHARERARELLSSFDLAEAGDRLVRTYSGGMRQAPRPRCGARRPAAGAVPRRADDRARSPQPHRALGGDRGARLRRDDRPADDAVPRRGRPAGRPHRRDRPGPRHRRGHARRAQGARSAASGSTSTSARASAQRTRSPRWPPIASDRPFAEDGFVRVPVAERRGHDRRGGPAAGRRGHRDRRHLGQRADARRRLPHA